jgi:hypothetical protein
MTVEQFEIYEDNELVSVYESKQTILNPEVAASHYTLLLVDMSGSVADSGGSRTLSAGAAWLVRSRHADAGQRPADLQQSRRREGVGQIAGSLQSRSRLIN